MVDNRQGWVDTFRGVAIILVVAGHVIGGLADMATIPNGSRLRPTYDWIYSFHMPAFMWASGLFVEPSYNRVGVIQFLKNKFSTLLYPYFIWAVVGWAILQSAAPFTNHPPPAASTLVRMVWCAPHTGPWFLYAMFELMLLAAIGRLLGFGPVARLAFAATGWATWAAADGELPAIISMPAKFGLYFALGELTNEAAGRFARSARQTTAIALAAGGLAANVVGVWAGWHLVPALTPIPAIAGICGLVGLAVFLARFRVAGPLQLCGRSSLEIYLLHPYPSVFTRAFLLKAVAVDGWLLHAVADTLAGVWGSVAVAWVMRRLGLGWLFRCPGLTASLARLPEEARPASAYPPTGLTTGDTRIR